MFPGKTVHVVPSSVDLEAWNPDGPNGYKFGGKRGDINLVLTDAWRDDIDPFVPLHAAALFARRVSGTRVHVYARPQKAQKGWGALLRRIIEDGNMGEVHGWVGGLANVYRAASALLTPQEIDTRSVRESMACGCPVVRLSNLDGWEEKILAGLKADRKGVRTEARFRFDPERTAIEFRKVLHSVWTQRQNAIAA
jgi:glycosyltransferase involved in cell wall biosynthesis